MGVGTTARSVEQFLGRRIESTTEFTVYGPNKTLAFKATSGPIPFVMTMAFEEVEGGTKLTFVAEAELGGFFKLAEPVVARMAKRQIDADFANLKDVLEAPA